ncbi:MAG: HNH endonuclease [Sedimentisphaerales bacterium]|nr:HNH endonuclease [Sedimentisphaerales bacterium]
MEQKPSNYGKLWEREELILAFDLYCRIPFQKTKANNPEVQQIAHLLNRSPASVARKLGNFGAFDPKLKAKNISGLEHGSRLDKKTWNDFHGNWNDLVLKAEKIRNKLFKQQGEIRKLTEITIPNGPSERTTVQKQRLLQSFFRKVILCCYQYHCCVTGISIPETLIASHIIPWSVDENHRADPSNGLCMTATFDRLFDCGLMAISDEYKILLSDVVMKKKEPCIQKHIVVFQNKSISMPEKFWPSKEYLSWHRKNVFRG